MAACTSPAGTAGAITWNGTDSVIWCNGTVWYALKDAGSVAAGSTGQIQFNNGSNALAADADLTWDNTNKRLGVGTNTPGTTLDVAGDSTFTGNAMFNLHSHTNAGWFVIQTDEAESPGFVLADPNSYFEIYVDTTDGSGNGTAHLLVGDNDAFKLRRGDGNASSVIISDSDGSYNDGALLVRNRADNKPAAVIAKRSSGATGDLLQVTDESLAPYLVVTSAGKMGIGTTSPAAALDVNGGIKVGDNAGGCSSTNSGEIKYVSGSSPPYSYCNGSAWVPFESSGFVPAYSKFTAAQVSSALYHVCALKSTGALWCWGYNNYGELGDGTTTNRFAPTQATGAFAGPWASISISPYNTCGIKSADGSGWCWGYNAYGQIGDGTTTNRTSAPVQLSGTWIQLATGGISSSNALINSGYYTCGVKSDNTGWCWGGNGTGNLGDGTTTQQNSPEQIAGSWLGIWMASYDSAHTCGIQTDDSLWCWGYNDYGQLGNGTTTSSSTPVQVSGSWSKVVLGERNTCGIKTDGTLWCWGYNGYGNLGDGTSTQRTSPVQVSGGGSWTKLAIETYSNSPTLFAIKSDGSAWSWGYNAYGDTKTGSTTTSLTSPTALATSTVTSGSSWSDFQGGYLQMCGIRDDSTLYCWGENNYYNRGGIPNVTTYFNPVGG